MNSHGRSAWERFFVPQRKLPQWSFDRPDRLIYWSDENGAWDLYAWDRSTGTTRQVTDRPAGALIHDGLPWAALSPSGDTIWRFEDGGGDEVGRWVTEPYGGSASASPVSSIPAGYPGGIALVRGLAIVCSLDQKGTTVWLIAGERAPRAIYRLDACAWLRGLSSNGQLISILHTEHGDYRHPAARIMRLDGTVVADRWDGNTALMDVGGWSPVGSPPQLVLFREAEGWRAPWLWTPENNAIRDLAVGVPGETRMAAWYPDGSALVVIQESRGRSTPYRVAIDSAEWVPLASSSGTVDEAAVRPDGSVWIEQSSATEPTGIYADDATVFQPSIPGARHALPYMDFDVGNVHGFLARPNETRPLPTVVLVHGGPEKHDQDRFCPRVQAWVERGFVVALVNYRGSTGYGASWREANCPDLGFTELDDIVRVCHWLIDHGVSDRREMVLAGHSWGGYLTLLSLGTHPDLWALGIAEAPTADFAAAYTDEPPWLRGWDRTVFSGSPENVANAYARHSPITYVEKIRAPILIVAGRKDPRAPRRQIEQFVNRLGSLGKQHQVVWHDGGHSCLRTDELVRIMRLELDFAARYLNRTAEFG